MDNSAIVRQPLTQVGVGQGISIRNLQKVFGGRRVLQAVNLEVAPGQFVAIIGRSGCGKSTLLRLIAGLETGEEGEIRLGQRPLSGLDEHIRLMFQDARLLPWRRTLDNVALGLPPQDRPRAMELLAQVGLAERARDWPAKLSGGQRQRVALARALVHRPAVLMLDEPLGALDALTRVEMQALIEDVWLDLGFTAVLVTHDVQEAVALADRVILIEDGRVALDRAIDLPRPRRRGSPAFAALADELLNRILKPKSSPVLNPLPIGRELKLCCP